MCRRARHGWIVQPIANPADARGTVILKVRGVARKYVNRARYNRSLQCAGVTAISMSRD